MHLRVCSCWRSGVSSGPWRVAGGAVGKRVGLSDKDKARAKEAGSGPGTGHL